MHLYNNTCLSYIVSAIGKPLYMNKGTSNQTHLDFARICIEVIIEDEIPTTLNVEVGDGLIVKIKVMVPWSLERCKTCHVFGHDCCEGKDDSKKQKHEEEKSLNPMGIDL